jgi:hypothetical protein
MAASNPTRAFRPGGLPAGKVTIAVGAAPDPLHRAIAGLTGDRPVTVAGASHHEIYLDEPGVLADFLHAGGSAAVRGDRRG